MPLVSAIMPCYNHQEYVSAAMRSVLDQTFSDLELIVIDDASKDNSPNIVRAAAESDHRVRAGFHDENQGLVKTINECIDMAQGKFVALLASDDLWVLDKLRKQLEVLNKNDKMVVWSEGLIVDSRGIPTGELFTQKYGASKKKKSGHIFEELLKGNFICGQSLILKREYFHNIRYDRRWKYLNDYKVMLDLAQQYEFYFMPEPLAMYRLHGANTVVTKLDACLEEDISIRNLLLSKYGSDIRRSVKAQMYYKLATLHHHFKDKPNAEQCFWQAFRLDPIGSTRSIAGAFLKDRLPRHVGRNDQ